MKNIFRIVMAVAILFTASCAKEDISSSIGGGEVEVTFTANLTDLGTRAYGDGDNAKRVYLGVYEADSTTPLQLVDYQKGYPVTNGKASITVVLLKDKKYDLVFWAQHYVDNDDDEVNDYAVYGRNWEDRSISVNYDGVLSQDDDRDAFFLVQNGFHAGHDETTFELRRPFAQLRAGISQKDYDYIKANGVTEGLKKSAAKVYGVANVLNLVDCSVDGEETVTFNGAPVPTGENAKFAVNGEEFYQISMNYILVNEKKLVDVEYNFSDGKTDYFRPYYNVPIQRNYRTNIIGQLISSPMDFNVIIKPEFEGEHNDVWDGQTVSEPAFDDATQTYSIVKPSEFAWLASAVNGTLETRAVAADSFKGKTFVLTEDIDLGYKEWTPIGNANSNFQGTFDGNGKTISSLYINTPSESNVGLFGMTTNGEIKNLTVKNAKVTGRLNVGVVAGTPYTSKYTDITVTGLIEVNGMAYVGAVGGKNAYADWTNITVNAAKGSYVKANSVENGTAYRTYVGGVVGFNGEGGHSFTNIKSNINVEGSTCDVGGLFGIAHYGNKFVDCSCSGNVTITEAAEAADAEEIGGIAGVWNNGGANVEFTNCKFTGTLSANVEFTPWYGGLVGKPYSASGSGKLVIDGISFDANGVIFDAINTALASGEYTFPFDLTGNAGASNGYGKTGINHGGYTLDGNGCTLKVNNAGATWDSALATKGGTIKNLTVAKGFRGIFVKNGTERVILENVTIDGPVYTISCDQAGNQGLSAYNSTFNGWTSYAATIGKVTFTNCEFGKGAGYAFCRPYAPTVFTNCNFAAGYAIDPRASVVFENCTINGVALTEANYAELVTSNRDNGAIAVSVNSTDAGQATLKETLSEGGNVILSEDVTTADTGSNGYGSTGVLVNGGILNGGGHTLNVTGANSTWDSAVAISSGTIKNITITGAFRGIFVKTGNDKVIIDNVVVDGPVYTISCDSASKQGLEASNSTFNGWTSYAATLGNAKFTNCYFGKGAGYAYFRPYAPTELVGCEFEAGFKIDARAAVTFENCTLGGVALTAENLATLVTGNTANATVK